jgi:hypothetical protein
MAIIVKSINARGHQSIHCNLRFLFRVIPPGTRRVRTSRSSDKPENLVVVLIEVAHTGAGERECGVGIIPHAKVQGFACASHIDGDQARCKQISSRTDTILEKESMMGSNCFAL